MTIARIELRQCRAGWRNYHFVKLTTADGVVGWSEFDEGYDAVGVSTAITHLAPHVLGEDVMANERIHARLCGVARQSLTGVLVRAIGAIENAVLDAKARALKVPCHALFGGKVRDRVRVYWSHCGTWRISRPDHYPPAVRSLDDVRALGAEVRARGFTALKTNIFRPTADGLRGWAPGFARAGDMERTPPRAVLTGLRDYLQALREGTGPDMDILLDLNFNARTEGYLSLLRALADRCRWTVDRGRPLRCRLRRPGDSRILCDALSCLPGGKPTYARGLSISRRAPPSRDGRPPLHRLSTHHENPDPARHQSEHVRQARP